LIVQAEALDRDYISYWAAQIGARDIWQQLTDEYQRRQRR
jgi:hypothetical protein